MNFVLKSFEDLTQFEVFKILRARCEVFIVEQQCPYPDPDELDFISDHLFFEEGGEIAAYCRITPKNTRFPEISIGRLITASKFRSRGLGRKIMEKAIAVIKDDMKECEIRISGQSYLRKFYESLGFIVCSGEYAEDNIPHYEFYRRL